MKRKRTWVMVGCCGAALAAAAILLAGAAERKAQREEEEQQVKARQVPRAALAALKKLAGDAELTGFSREREHGSVFYEGTFRNKSGAKVDALVTPDGSVVEIEEQVLSLDTVPPATLKAARNMAGEDTPLRFEKKTLILYEAKFRKGNRFYEVLLTPDGRKVEEEVERGGEEEEEEAEAGEEEEEEAEAEEEEEEEEEAEEAGERERQLSLEKLPEAVRTTLLEAAGDHKIREIEMERYKGRKVYAAEWREDGAEVEVLIAPDGKLLRRIRER